MTYFSVFDLSMDFDLWDFRPEYKYFLSNTEKNCTFPFQITCLHILNISIVFFRLLAEAPMSDSQVLKIILIYLCVIAVFS